MFHFLPRTAAGIYSKLGTNVPYRVPTKCCYFYVDLKSKMATLVSDWLTYKKLIILRTFCFNFLSGIYKKTLFNIEVHCMYTY